MKKIYSVEATILYLDMVTTLHRTEIIARFKTEKERDIFVDFLENHFNDTTLKLFLGEKFREGDTWEEIESIFLKEYEVK